MKQHLQNTVQVFSFPDVGQLNLTESPFRIYFSDKFDSERWQIVASRFRDKTGQWHIVDNGEIINQSPNSVTLQLSTSSSKEIIQANFSAEQDSIIVDFSCANPEENEWLSIDLLAAENEHFLGLGERFNQVDQRGNEIDLYVVNGASGGRTYMPIPFYISSNGYGLQMLTDTRCLVRFATPDDPQVVSIRNSQPSLRMRFFLGDSSKDILSSYTRICGRHKLPPAWVFGPWKSRDWMTENQKTTEEDILFGRKYNLAGTVKLIDAAWQPYYHTFAFDRKRFPDPEGMIRQLRGLGYRLVLWITPWLVKDAIPSPEYEECSRNGFFIKNPEGETYAHRLGSSPTFIGSCIDFTNPNAVKWWKEKIRNLCRMGVDGFKTDFGEQVPDNAIFYDGRTGKEVHNIYPRLYKKATFEAMSEVTDGFLLTRSAWDGSQPFCGVWAGDQSSDFCLATGLPSVIIAAQNAGLSGFPFWASDIGGYFGTPTDEVFIRWTQFGAFSPIMQIHGVGKREPWAFSEKTLEIYKRYARLHMDLFPYIFSYAKIASETGLPIIRALAFEFSDDPGLWGDIAEHEYCFGSELFVAPVYSDVNECRTAYVPKGNWRNFWDGTQVEGGRMQRFHSDIETIPVLAKCGAIIPMLDPSPDTVLPVEGDSIKIAGNDLKLIVYPGQNGLFNLFDGTQFAWDENLAVLIITNSPCSRFVSIKIFDPVFQLDLNKIKAFDESHKPLELTIGSLNGEPDFIRIAIQANQKYSIHW